VKLYELTLVTQR